MRFPKPTRSAKAPKKLKPPRKRRKGKRASIARECDRLCGAIVRSRGACEVCERSVGVTLQWAHGFSRKYRATRWLPLNGFCLCSGCHWRFTNDPLGWDNYLRVGWGAGVYADLRRLALKNAKQDMPAIVAKLRAEAERLGIK